jgi:hypothetical protein
VSAGGGAKPRWRRDGKELYFLAPDGTLMAAAIAARAGGGRVEAGRPAALFKTAAPERPGYEVSADGQRFLVGAAASKISSTPLIVVVNWIALVQPPR